MQRNILAAVLQCGFHSMAEATAAGFTNLKGHRVTGGMRASIYNAMPVEGVEKLCDFIKEFDKNN